MKIGTLLHLSLFSLSLNETKAVTPPCSFYTSFADFAPKTIFIKNPTYTDSENFFSSFKTLQFEIFKAGTAGEVEKLVKKFASFPDVASCNAGKAYGDYQSFVLTLKIHKDRAWFVAAFKKVGLNLIKINNNPPIMVDKM